MNKFLSFLIIFFLNISLVYSLSFEIDLKKINGLEYKSNQFSGTFNEKIFLEYEIDMRSTSKEIYCLVSNSKITKLTNNFSVKYSEKSFFIEIKIPTKEELNYSSEGILEVGVNLLCDINQEYDDPFLIKNDGLIISYSLKEDELGKKIYLDDKLINLTEDFNLLKNEFKSLNELYSVFKNKVKIDDLRYNEIDNSIGDIEDFFEKISGLTNKLNYGEAYKLFENSNYNSDYILELNQKINQTKGEIKLRREKHNELVKELEEISNKLKENKDSIEISKLNKDFENFENKFNELSLNLEKLNFKSYGEIEENIKNLKFEIDNFILSLFNLNKEKYNFIKEIYLNKYKEIGKNKLFSSKFSKDFFSKICYDLNYVLPIEIEEYNLKENIRINNLVEKQEKYNKEIDLLKNEYEDLNKLISKLKIASKELNYDNNFKNNCNLEIINLNLNKELNKSILKNTFEICNNTYTSILNNEYNSFFGNLKFKLNNFFNKKEEFEQVNLLNLKDFKRNDIFDLKEVELDNEILNVAKVDCNIKTLNLNLNKLEEIENITIKKYNKVYFSENDFKNDFCYEDNCCKNNECYSNYTLFPVLFVHGHSFMSISNPMKGSIETFDDMIFYLENNYNNFKDLGIIVPKGFDNLNLNLKNYKKIPMFRTTYYGGAEITKEGDFQFSKFNQDSITVYADRLNNVINKLLEVTNREKVKIVSHSMGGLVTREYIRKYGKDKIENFVMIGTPNKGTGSIIGGTCSFVGADNECSDMKEGSLFLEKLNSMTREDLPKKTKIIAGIYSNSYTDGIVLYKNTKVEGVEDYKIEANEKYQPLLDTLINRLHNELLEPEKYEEVSIKVEEYLK